MNAQNIVIHRSSQTYSAGGNGKFLKEGSPVLVRIISDKGGGKYEASVAGVRLSLSSVKPQKVGASFVGTVSVNNGKIQINPAQDLQTQITKASGFEVLDYDASGDLFAEISNETVAAFFNNLGIIPDNLSFQIFNQMKQLELKIDPNVLNKIHGIAKKFKGKENAAVEILLNFYKKGIEPSEKELALLLSELGAEFGDSDEAGDSENKEFRNKKFNDSTASKTVSSDYMGEIISDFANAIFCGLDNQNHKIGSLTISNHILSKKGSGGSWFMFPFEIIEALENQNTLKNGNTLENNNVLGTGRLRFFIDGAKRLSTVKVNCLFDSREFLFKIAMKNNHVKEVLMNVFPCQDNEKSCYLEKFSKGFLALHKNADLLWAEKNELDSEQERIYFFEADV